jgi:hypothetical protein
MKCRPGGVIITLGSLNISKRYTSPDRSSRVSHITTIYLLLEKKGVPNVDRLIGFASDEEQGSIIYLHPKGVDSAPQSEKEIIKAVECVLQALLVCLMTLQSDVAC